MALKSVHRLVALPLLAVLAVLPACDRLSGSGGSDGSERPANDHTLADSKGRWKGLSAKCPSLSSTTVPTLPVSGEGRPSPYYVTTRSLIKAECLWDAQNSSVETVNTEIDLYSRTEGADTAWDVLTTLKTDTIPGLGDEAFSYVMPDTYTLHVRSANSVLRVKVTLRAGAGAKPETYAPAVAAAAQDALATLR